MQLSAHMTSEELSPMHPSAGINIPTLLLIPVVESFLYITCSICQADADGALRILTVRLSLSSVSLSVSFSLSALFSIPLQ